MSAALKMEAHQRRVEFYRRIENASGKRNLELVRERAEPAPSMTDPPPFDRTVRDWFAPTRIYERPVGPVHPDMIKRDFINVASKAPKAPLVELSENQRAAKRIITDVCSQFLITKVMLCADRRAKRYVLPRHIVMYRLKHETTWSLVAIGNYMGGRDHTTVLHAYRRIKALIEAGELVL